MITIEKLELLQRDFDASLHKLPSLSFSSISSSYLDRILRDELKFDPPAWPFWIYNGSGICIYYECLWKYYIDFAYVDPKAKQLRDDLLVLLMTYRPLAYFMNSIRVKYQDLEIFNSHILEILDKKHIATSQAINLRELIKLNSPSPNDLSTLAFFHYFLNFSFDPNLVGISRETLDLNRNGSGLIVVNPTYKDIYNSRDTYIYRKASDRLGQLLLTPDSIRSFAPIVKVESLQRDERAWVESHLTENGNQIALQYSENVFTLSTSTLSRDDALSFIEGGAINLPFPHDKLYKYTITQFYHLLGRNLAPPVEKPTIFTNFGQFLWEIINPLFQAHSLANFDYSQFILNVMASASEKRILPEPELKTLATYLGVYPGSRDASFEIQEFLDYLRHFISPELN